MQRRALFAAPLLVVPAFGAGATASTIASTKASITGPIRLAELRVGAGHAEATLLRRSFDARIVTASAGGWVEKLNRGHLELALLSDDELREARARMGPRLALLGRRGTRHLVSRTALPAAWRDAMESALA